MTDFPRECVDMAMRAFCAAGTVDTDAPRMLRVAGFDVLPFLWRDEAVGASGVLLLREVGRELLELIGGRVAIDRGGLEIVLGSGEAFEVLVLLARTDLVYVLGGLILLGDAVLTASAGFSTSATPYSIPIGARDRDGITDGCRICFDLSGTALIFLSCRPAYNYIC